MRLEFLPKAMESFQEIKGRYPEKAVEIKEILKDTLAHPETGLGNPVVLDGAYKGIWQRKLSGNDTIYYVSDAEKVTVLAISTKNFSLSSFSDEDYASVLEQMSSNRGKDSEPKVGIFWYNRAKNELFGVVSHRVSDYTKANASNGRITCSEMHEDVWKHEFRKQKYGGDNRGPYIGAYQDKPRGRVFYNIDSDTYEVAVGKWIEEFPQAYDLILEEFDLPKDRTTAKYAEHWDIGMSWR